MDHDDTALVGTADSFKPWTIKSVANEVRDLANIAARREGLTVGQWLERVIRAATTESDGRSLTLSPPRSAMVSPPQSDRAELRELVAMAREATPGKDSDALKLARRIVRDRLLAVQSAG